MKPTKRSCPSNATTTTKDTDAVAEKSADDVERKLHDASLQGKIPLELFCGVAAVAAGACRHAGIVGVGIDILDGFDLTRALFAVYNEEVQMMKSCSWHPFADGPLMLPPLAPPAVARWPHLSKQRQAQLF